MTFEEMARAGAHELDARERFAAEGMEAIGFGDHWLSDFCKNALSGVMRLLDTVEAEARSLDRAVSTEFLDQMASVLALVNKIQLVIVPAAYALDANAQQGLTDVIERYMTTCLGIQLTKPAGTKVKGDGESWQMSSFVWEALGQKRWLKADNPEAYIETTAKSLFMQAQKQADKEYIQARKIGKTLVNESGVTNYKDHIENIVDCESPPVQPDTSLRATRLLTEQLAHCGAILENGGSVTAVAEYLGVNAKHVHQEVKRMRHRAKLADQSEPISFEAELRHLLPKLEYQSSSDGHAVRPGGFRLREFFSDPKE